MGKAFASIEERRLYIRNHQRVARRRGKASEHTCSCGAPAREWAQLHGKDGSADEHFEAMCHKCHQRYDGRWSPEERERVAASVKANWDAHHTREFSDETRAKMSASQQQRWQEDPDRKSVSKETRVKMRTSQQARREREKGGSTV